MDTRRAWVVWIAGLAAYVVAITQRTSFGVAGVAAIDRFDATASALSAFAVIQLVVYASLQIPVGVLADRFGSRVMIAGGAVLMAVGQLQLAAATTIPAGVFGRVLVGAGDAMTFICVLRLVPLWFPPTQVPLLSQLTGIVGMGGQLLSSIPFAALLGRVGWSAAFVSLAATGVLAAVLAVALVRSEPPGSASHGRTPTVRQTGRMVADAFAEPGTRLGLWSHFTVQFPGQVFVLAWGYPFLVSGQGIAPELVAVLMTVFVVAGAVGGPFLGRLVALRPRLRSRLVLGIAVGILAAWAAVLLYPGRAPFWLLAVLVVALAAGGPGSMIGFDFAREYNPPQRLGTANGIVNIGGFTAALVSMYLIGLILDVLRATGFSGGNLYALDAFRIALAVQGVLIVAGVLALLGVRRILRRRPGTP
ncbi:MFS transporter [Tersicoccus solisilvae]|uniref:MFS transporter n=1 Tax=Tersicoccus solisilvae TaxID=1882339 RepID=A0ABQ1PQW9_9MICC|nr:MFS transporter [Tersicoccus solisilvae]GGD01005.1 MFS transporter [Tersicoccus solisilvae]